MRGLDYSAEEYVGTQIHTSKTQRGPVARQRADVVIVGTGPGGLTAARILADSGAKVVMLEAGSFWPRGSFERSQSWALRNLVQDNGTRLMMGNTHVPLMSGKGVGGGTLINSGISFRAPDRVLDEWTQTAGTGFWEDRDELYTEVEQFIGVTKTPPSIAGNNALLIRKGFSRMEGVDHDFMPRNTPGCIGCGTCQTGCPSGGKASADLNWLPKALADGALLYADTRAEEILMDGERAIGVRGAMRDPDSDRLLAEVEVFADKVLLACGAVNTPTLLLEQKLANSSGLVGRNLHVQPGSAIVAEFDEEVKIWQGATQGYYAWHPDDPEILSEAFSSSPETFYAAVGEPGQQGHAMLRWMKHFGAAGCLIRDHSSGVITPSRKGPPSITYDVSDDDRRKLTVGTEFVARMFFEAGARNIFPLLGGSRWFDDFGSARKYIRTVKDPADYVLYASHPMGTCQLGTDPDTSVCRPSDGRTHDHEGLYVMDASLMPTAIGANPQMTIMAQSIALSRQIARTG